MPDGSEEQIRNALLQSAYDQREGKNWLTARQILKGTELELKVKEINNDLLILCDRGLLAKQTEKTPTLKYPKGAKKAPYQYPSHPYLVFRITSDGEELVRMEFKRRESSILGGGMAIANSPEASVMINSPHGQQISYRANPELGVLIEELRTLINRMPDNSEKKDVKQLAETLEEECNKPLPKRAVIEIILDRLAKVGQISTAVLQIASKLGITV